MKKTDMDWNALVLGDDDSQAAPICNGQVREMIQEIYALRSQVEFIRRDAVKLAKLNLQIDAAECARALARLADWGDAPSNIRFGDGIMLADIELSQNETITIYAHRDVIVSLLMSAAIVEDPTHK